MLGQLAYFFDKVSAEKESVTIDGYPAFKGNDKFLPGKIAVGFSHSLLALPKGSPELERRLRDFRDIADRTVALDNHTWGIYYYLLALYKLKSAGLLDQAVSAPTLSALRKKLDWRTFVTTPDYKLINLPANYYGVAFSVARLRFLLGWEDESGSKQLMDKMLRHYEAYSGKFGFSDETDGEGRFDRYSVLLIAEICERHIETGIPVPAELKALLRKSADIALRIVDASGDGFSFGRSIGPYGDTAVMEILTAAAYLDVLSAEEKRYAHAIVSCIAAKYVSFWFDKNAHSVDMWNQGRRTDAYRGRHRILGENLSLLHQFLSANELWNQAGFRDGVGEKQPPADLAAWLDKTQPSFSLNWFARGEYDRALAVFRDHGRVFSLPVVNGGAGQHANSPYYPLPFSDRLIAGVADSDGHHPQLMPVFTLADGSRLIASAYARGLESKSEGEGENRRHRVSYRQTEMDRLGAAAPIKDARLQVETEYVFAPGVVTRVDRYRAPESVEVREVTLEFGSFSEGATQDGLVIRFHEGAVSEFEVTGLNDCKAEATGGDNDFKSPSGPMKTRITCRLGAFSMKEPLTIQWTMRYR